jgi:phosphatidylglycerophosphate synthase
MSKLPGAYKFIDLSDYGRPIARQIAISLKETSFTPVQVTCLFIISGLIAIVGMLFGYYYLAAFFLVLKSILDAADGELARIKETPSYTGRFLDSIADILLNALIFYTLYIICDISFIYAFLGFLGIQLQGTLYNYYYTILRNKLGGDKTSRVFEIKTPRALKGEKQSVVNKLFLLYKLFYGPFDKIIYTLDSNASKGGIMSKYFMTCISTFGLGFQLLIISAMLVLGLIEFILAFFLIYTVMVFIFISIRKVIFKSL